MRVPYMGVRQEFNSLRRCFVFHEGNSHREKTALYVLCLSVIALLGLRAFGLVSFEDPRVASFVDFGVDMMKLAAAYLFGSTVKGERVQTKLRDLGHDPVKLLAEEAIHARIDQLQETDR